MEEVLLDASPAEGAALAVAVVLAASAAEAGKRYYCLIKILKVHYGPGCNGLCFESVFYLCQ